MRGVSQFVIPRAKTGSDANVGSWSESGRAEIPTWTAASSHERTLAIYQLTPFRSPMILEPTDDIRRVNA
jgi:hypothetical protein